MMMDEQSVKDEFKKTESLVRNLLETDERCRNSDLWLILKIWQEKQHIKIFIPYDKLNDMISTETITRCRRKIQNTKGEFLPTKPEILIQRRFKEDAVRRYFGQDSTIHRSFLSRYFEIR
jgi:hypothetical protein